MFITIILRYTGQNGSALWFAGEKAGKAWNAGKNLMK